MRHLWVFIVPSFIVGLATILRQASGPFWLGKNLDPEYAYLMNALSLTQGLSVGHSDHPGSTLQWTEAIWLYGIYFLRGKDELLTDVLTRSEFYLAHMHMILLSILFFTLLIAGWLTLRWTGDFVAALLMQVGILISFTARNALSRISPEPLLLILGVWLAITVLYHHHLIQKGHKTEPFWQYGLIAGVGMGLKITFLPLGVLPLVLLKGGRHLIYYLGISGIVFFALAANPLMNFSGFKNFTLNHLIAREGYNQPLELGSSHFKAMLDGLYLLTKNIWELEKPLLFLMLIFVANGLLVLLVKSNRERNKTGSWNVRLWSGLLFTLFGQIFLLSNGPKANLHYLCPALGLLGLLTVISWKWPDWPPNSKPKSLSWSKTTYLAVIVTLIGLTLLKLPREFEIAAAGAQRWQEAHQFKTDNHLLNEASVYYYRSSSIPYALSFGNILARRHFSQQLSSLYPNFFVFHKWNQQIYIHFGKTEVTLDDIVRQAGTVLIQGQKNNPPIIPSLEGTPYYGGSTTPFRKPSDSTIPTKSPHEFSAEVIFVGSSEWIVLLKSQTHGSSAEEIDLIR